MTKLHSSFRKIIYGWINFQFWKPLEFLTKQIYEQYKFALLWGEAQKKIAYSYLKVT